jgi:hypothetical protein
MFSLFFLCAAAAGHSDTWFMKLFLAELKSIKLRHGGSCL